MAVTLSDAKLYLRVDTSDDDSFIQTLIDLSTAFIANAVDNPDTSSPVYDMAQRLLIVHWYENRSVDYTVPGLTGATRPFGLDALLLQLQHPPLTLTVCPADGDTGVAVDATVSWTFSRSLSSSLVTHENFYVALALDGSKVGGDLSISVDGKTVTFTPDGALASATQYTSVAKAEATGLPDNTVATFTTA
ncbi:MAG: head-tail connector protein [Alicyclobacillus sp.]|nr:head-tail connector protein [Alicyclobacillus sp.]